MKDGHVAVRWNDVQPVGQHVHLVLGLDHRHGRTALQDLAQDAGVVGVEVLHQHEAHAAVDRHRAEELFEGLDPASRSAEPDDREGRHRHGLRHVCMPGCNRGRRSGRPIGCLSIRWG